MNLNEFIFAFSALGCDVNVHPSTSTEWLHADVVSPDGVELGQVVFHLGETYRMQWDDVENDFYQMAFMYYKSCGEILLRCEYEDLVGGDDVV